MPLRKWRTRNFDSKSLKSLSRGQFFGSSNSRRHHWIFKLLVTILKSEVWEQNCVWLFYYFYFERNYNVLKSKSRCFLKWNRKWKIQKRVLERRTLCFSSYKNRNLKVKLWWVGTRERKKSSFFVTFISSEEIFFSISVLSQYIDI